MSTNSKQRALQLFILITGSVVIILMTYFSGMKSTVKKSRLLDDQRKVAEQKYREAQRDLRVRLALTEQLEARRRLALAMQELDNRNFGTAQDHLNTAVKMLEEAQAGGATVPDLLETARQLAATSLTATDNLGEQRSALLALTRQVDEALNDFVPPFLTEKIREDIANPVQKPSLNDVPLAPGKEVGRRSKE